MSGIMNKSVLVPACFLVAVLSSNDGLTACERWSYEFKGPDKYFQLRLTTARPRAPTVILSHGAGGYGNLQKEWADLLVQAGYNAFLMDHYSPRGVVASECPPTGQQSEEWRRSDTLTVLGWVASRPDLDPGNLVLMGFSAGTAAVFPVVSKSRFLRDIPDGVVVRAGVLFYPWSYACRNAPGDLVIPALMMIGTEDGVWKCWSQSRWLSRQQASGKLRVEIYPGCLSRVR